MFTKKTDYIKAMLIFIALCISFSILVMYCVAMSRHIAANCTYIIPEEIKNDGQFIFSKAKKIIKEAHMLDDKNMYVNNAIEHINILVSELLYVPFENKELEIKTIESIYLASVYLENILKQIEGDKK